MDNRDTALSFFKKVGEGDLDGAVGLFSKDARYWNPGMGESDIPAMRELLAGAGALTDGPMEMQILGAIADGDRVAVEARSSVKLKNGKHYANAYCFVFAFDGAGRIVSLKEYCDTAPTAVFAGG